MFIENKLESSYYIQIKPQITKMFNVIHLTYPKKISMLGSIIS